METTKGVAVRATISALLVVEFTVMGLPAQAEDSLGSVRGTVTDTDGGPIGEICVYASGDDAWGFAETNGSGI